MLLIVFGNCHLVYALPLRVINLKSVAVIFFQLCTAGLTHTNSLSEVTLKGAEKPCVESTPECPQLTGVLATSPAATDHCQTKRWSRFIKRGLALPNERCKKGITDCPMLAAEEENERQSATGRENPGACIVRWGSADSRISRWLSQVTAVL